MKKLLPALFVVLASSSAYAQSTLYSNSATGDVGIGTSSPAGTLDVEGGTAAASTAGSNINIVAQSAGTGNESGGNIILTPGAATGTGTPGYVGIGTATPDALLSIYGSASQPTAQLDARSPSGSYVGYNADHLGTGDYGGYYLLENGTGVGYVQHYGSTRGGARDNGVELGSIASSNAFLAFRPNDSEAMRITTAGLVGIGTTSPSYTLHVNGSVAGTSAYVNLSDARYKKNIEPLESGLREVEQLRPVTFEYKVPKDIGMEGQQIGFTAQDVEMVLPSVVVTEDNDEGTKEMKYSELIPVLTKAIQELKADKDDLRREFEAYKVAHP
jgi:Chaperone of endosialidase